MKTKPDEPLIVQQGVWIDEMNKTHGGRGLTKREHFASLCLQGLLAGPVLDVDEPIQAERALREAADNGKPGSGLAKSAIIYADALIEELNKEKV